MATETKTTTKKAPAKTATTKAQKPEKEKIVKAKVEEPVVDVEKQNLKNEISELKAQIELMAKMMASQKSEEVSKPVKKDRPIRIVNLTNGSAILKGSTIWEIKGRFGERTFLDREARLIVNNMRNMISAGMIYIADAQFVEENDLGEIYSHLLSDKDLKELLKHDASYIIDAYKTVCDGQKKVIIDMIMDEKEKGIKIDGNVLIELGELSGLDLLSED